MAIIKAPPKQPKSVTIQARVEESVKTQLDQYAKFIDSTPSYVITEALKVLFKRDDEFKAWLGQQSETTEKSMSSQEADSKRPRNTNEGRTNTTRHAREHSVAKTACLAPCNEWFFLTVRSSHSTGVSP